MAIAGIVAIFIVGRVRSKRKRSNNNIELGHDDLDSGNENVDNKGNTEDIESLLGEEGSNFKENSQKK
jgi:hypothetical protein